ARCVLVSAASQTVPRPAVGREGGRRSDLGVLRGVQARGDLDLGLAGHAVGRRTDGAGVARDADAAAERQLILHREPTYRCGPEVHWNRSPPAGYLYMPVKHISLSEPSPQVITVLVVLT